MQLRLLLFLTHTLAGLAVGILVAGLALAGFTGWVLGVAIVGPILLSVAVALVLSSRLYGPLLAIEAAVVKADSQPVARSGILEFDAVADRVRERAGRWAEAAATSREQAQEIEVLIERLNRRSGGARGRAQRIGTQLRQLLASVAQASDAELEQILKCTKDIERYAKEIARGAEQQSDAVSKSTTYVEQMSANIDSVTRNAGAAQQAASTTRDAAAAALELVEKLVEGMERIRTHVGASESRLRALGEHSQEIGSIVETIGAISSRTDMLALNASIESVRAGEHGRGFAVVAEEVRKLAEQAAQATREVAGLIESIQLETQESVSLMVEERREVQTEVERVRSAGAALRRISQVSRDSATQVGEITAATQLQLQLTTDVVLAMERIADVAKSSRARAEEACWTVNTLSKLAERFGTSLQPLRLHDAPPVHDTQNPAAGVSAVELVPPATADETTSTMTAAGAAG